MKKFYVAGIVDGEVDEDEFELQEAYSPETAADQFMYDHGLLENIEEIGDRLFFCVHEHDADDKVINKYTVVIELNATATKEHI